MLFILSGNIQSGKSRWLEQTAHELEDAGVALYGVLAPGIWAECGPGNARNTGAGGGGAWDKRGIYNILLPGWERLVFARRDEDYVPPERFENPGAWMPKPGEDPGKPGLWVFDDSVMERVNAHFARAARSQGRFSSAESAAGDAPSSPQRPRLLIVDEIGQFELFLGRGLTNAMALLDSGASGIIPHALVVVRSELLDAGLERLSPVAEGWGGLEIIGANEDGFELLKEYSIPNE